uniref:Uncharacterized protein n=1 Tax=Cucumis melo TaxID=3656 RepID=A0A9I9EDG7_CUCME
MALFVAVNRGVVYVLFVEENMFGKKWESQMLHRVEPYVTYRSLKPSENRFGGAECIDPKSMLNCGCGTMREHAFLVLMEKAERSNIPNIDKKNSDDLVENMGDEIEIQIIDIFS